MNRSRTFAAIFLSLVASAALAQPPETPVHAPNNEPTTLLPQQATPTGPRTMNLDPVTLFPPGGPPYSLFSPFEVYARPFGAVVEGTGALSEVLSGGVGADFGVRSFLYNAEHTAAWYGDVGMGYQYNRGSDPDRSVIVREGLTNVSRLGTIIQLDSTTSLGIRELHRTTARIAFGREFYWQSRWMDSVHYSWGGDVGGVWGQASIKTNVNSQVIPDIQPTDVVLYTPNDGHSSGVTKGFFLGTNFNVIVPRHTHDFIVGTRFEWQREYFSHLVNNNDGTGQLKFILEFGWRY